MKLRKLGRRVEHDDRSRSFGVVRMLQPLHSVSWKRHGQLFDQGNLGSCTCEAAVGVLMTEPFYSAGRLLNQNDAVDLYKQATRIDTIPGHWPPDDTGSSGLAAAKAAHKRGWLKAYHHAFSLHDALSSLVSGPGMLGISWYEGFDEAANGLLEISGEVRGGHEIEVSEIDVERKLVRGPNSWGSGWGDKGFFTMTWATLERLLHENGDYVVPQK